MHAYGAAFDNMDRFHLVNDVINRVPALGGRGAYLGQLIRDKLTDHKRYIREYGEDMPEIRDWRWGARVAALRPSDESRS